MRVCCCPINDRTGITEVIDCRRMCCVRTYLSMLQCCNAVVCSMRRQMLTAGRLCSGSVLTWRWYHNTTPHHNTTITPQHHTTPQHQIRSWRLTRPGHHTPIMELLSRNWSRHRNLLLINIFYLLLFQFHNSSIFARTRVTRDSVRKLLEYLPTL